MAMGLYDAAFATVGTLLGREAVPVITGITLFAGFASTVFWSLGSAIIGTTGWRGLLLLYAGIMLCINLPMVLAFVPRLDRNLKDLKQMVIERTPVSRLVVVCLASFFTLRWFITSALAVHILVLLKGIGLNPAQAVIVASMVGPGQVAQDAFWKRPSAAASVFLLRARLGALFFPAGAAIYTARRARGGGGGVRGDVWDEQRDSDDQPRNIAARVVWAEWLCDRIGLARGAGATGAGGGAHVGGTRCRDLTGDRYFYDRGRSWYRRRAAAVAVAPATPGLNRSQKRLDRGDRDLGRVFLNVMACTGNFDDRPFRPQTAKVGDRQSRRDRAVQHAPSIRIARFSFRSGTPPAPARTKSRIRPSCQVKRKLNRALAIRRALETAHHKRE